MGQHAIFHESCYRPLTYPQRYRKTLFSCLLFIAAFAVLSSNSFLRHDFLFDSPSPSPSPSQAASPTGINPDYTLSPDDIQAIHNSTLGFGDIYIINMPKRTDKLDTLRLLASVSNLSYTVIPGVLGEDIPHVAWPGFYREEMTSKTGLWRAHIDAVAAILDNNLSSALILEDDADWDVNLKDQLTQFALANRHISNSSASSNPSSPYGDGWDMLWIGHCAQDPPDKPFARFFIANETTIPPAGQRWSMWNPEKTLTYDLPHNRTTRTVYRSTGGVCGYAKALSYTGAQKFLYHLSYSHFDPPLDFGVSKLCKRGAKGEIDFNCVGVYPGLIHAAFLENDVEYHPDTPRKDRDKEKATPSAPNLAFSVRENLLNMIEGKEVKGKWQEKEEMGEMKMWFDEGKAARKGKDGGDEDVV